MLGVFGTLYGLYFVWVFNEAANRPVSAIDYQTLILVTVVSLVVVAALGHVVIAYSGKQATDVTDERDKLFNLRGEYVGGLVLAAGVLVALAMAMVEYQYFWIAQTLLAALVLAEMTSGVVKVLHYRRGV